jgi:hypothetical protein
MLVETAAPVSYECRQSHQLRIAPVRGSRSLQEQDLAYYLEIDARKHLPEGKIPPNPHCPGSASSHCSVQGVSLQIRSARHRRLTGFVH